MDAFTGWDNIYNPSTLYELHMYNLMQSNTTKLPQILPFSDAYSGQMLLKLCFIIEVVVSGGIVQ